MNGNDRTETMSNDPEFRYVLNGMQLLLVSRNPNGEVIQLGKLLFSDMRGDRPDLLQLFLSRTGFYELS